MAEPVKSTCLPCNINPFIFKCELFRNIETSAEFLENMAGLLAGKIEERNQNQSLNQMILEREAIMDLLSIVFEIISENLATNPLMEPSIVSIMKFNPPY